MQKAKSCNLHDGSTILCFFPFQYLGQLRRKKPACARYHPLSSITNTLVNAQTNTATSVTGGEATRRGEEREERREGGWAYLKKRAARCRTPESLQRWKPGPSRSVCQLADTGMRGLFIGSVKRQTFGGHLVWVQLSVSISPLLFFQTMLRKHGRATLGAP